MFPIASATDEFVQPAEHSHILTDEAYARLERVLHAALRTETNTLIAADTGLGKSHLVSTTKWSELPEITGGSSVVHLHPSRKARDEAVERSEAAGLNALKLLGREEACPLAAGDYDDILMAPGGMTPSEWLHVECDQKLTPFSMAHDYLRAELARDPCSECKGVAQWNALRDAFPEDGTDEDTPPVDIIHATDKFGRVPTLVADANVIYDEQPDSRIGVVQDFIRREISSKLQQIGGIDYTWEGLVETMKAQDVHTLRCYEELITEFPPSTDFWERPDHHALAPAIARAVMAAKPVGNNRFRGQDGRLIVSLDTENNIRCILHRPNLSEARCVIGLDAHPTERLWRANTVDDLETIDVFSAEERSEWRLHERGLYVVRIGNEAHARPLTQGFRSQASEDELYSIIDGLRREFGGKFKTCITSKKAKPTVKQMMHDVGIVSPRLMHFGEERSRNDFSPEEVGAVFGCIDPGDDEILDWLALLDLRAEPEMYENANGERKRAYGRRFVGPDADAAAECLASVREAHLAQSIGRYARNARDADSVAIVFVWSGAVPEEMVNAEVPGVIRRVTQNKQNVLRVLREWAENGEATHTTTEIADQSPCSRKHVLDILKEMMAQIIVTKSEGTGTYGANEYTFHGGELATTVDICIETESLPPAYRRV